MADITWPSALVPLSDGYNETLPDGRIRTKMNAGPYKVRRRYTAAAYSLAFNLWVTQAEYLVLRSFWLTTTKMGSLKFNFTHPALNTAVEARFLEPPNIFDVAFEGKIAIELEVLP